MRATGSTRTATRCSSSDATRLLRSAAAVAGLLLAGACVTTVTHAFTPDANAERMSLADAQDTLDRMVRLECPRLMEAKHDTDDARISVEVDGSGNVQRATMSKVTGDERMDRIFGGVAAQMRFAAADDGKPFTGRMRVGYSCSPAASTATIQLID